MNSGVMGMYHNNPYTYIDKPEDFFQYCGWLLRENEGKKINVITYIRPVNCNVQNLNGSKDLEKFIGLVIIKNTKNKHHYSNLNNIIYATKPTKKPVKYHSNITTSLEVSEQKQFNVWNSKQT